MKLQTAVKRAVRTLDGDQDKGACELAVTYAKAIDDGADLDTYGPLLLTTLDALLLTPKARANVMKGARRGADSPLDELRARRAARQRHPAAMDTTTP